MVLQISFLHKDGNPKWVITTSFGPMTNNLRHLTYQQNYPAIINDLVKEKPVLTLRIMKLLYLSRFNKKNYELIKNILVNKINKPSPFGHPKTGPDLE